MKQTDRNESDDVCGTRDIVFCRRVAVGSSGLAVLGLLVGSAFGRAKGNEGERSGLPREIRERMEESRALSARLRNAGSLEERMKIMEERRARERVRAIDSFRGQLGVSEAEWKVIRPRIEKVYDLVHPHRPLGPGRRQSEDPVERSRRGLRELLSDGAAPADAIKAKLTALRSAQEKARQELAQARQDLRRLMTLRQEAHLVLHGLLD